MDRKDVGSVRVRRIRLVGGADTVVEVGAKGVRGRKMERWRGPSGSSEGIPVATDKNR